MEKRKIIEIYLVEDKENDSASFEFEKKENSDLTNFMMEALLSMINYMQNVGDTLEIELEDKNNE